MEFLQGIIPDYLIAYLTLAVTICAAITTVLPQPKEGGHAAYRVLYRTIQWVALNLGRARNAQDAAPYAPAKTVPDDGKR